MIFLRVGVFLASIFVKLGCCLVKETYEYLKKELILTVNILFFIIYPSIVKVLLSHFNCQSFDILGQFIFSDLAVRCWNIEYKRKTFTLVLPGVTIWVVGLPTLILALLIKNRYKLHTDFNRYILGYLFNGFKKSAFYWEFVNIYRKLLIVSILVFVDKDLGSVQALILFGVILLSTMLHFKIRPYNSKVFNKLELYSLITGLLTNFCGLFYLNSDLSESVNQLLYLIILISNILFLAYWSCWFFSAFYDFLLKNIPCLKRFSKLDAFESEFYVEEIVHQGSYIDKDQNTKMYTFFSRPKENIERFNVKNFNALYKEVFDYELQSQIPKFEPEYDEPHLFSIVSI